MLFNAFYKKSIKRIARHISCMPAYVPKTWKSEMKGKNIKQVRSTNQWKQISFTDCRVILDNDMVMSIFLLFFF